MADIAIYGIDHGNGNMKMEHAEIFPCGLVRQNIEPIVFGNMEYIKYEDFYYMLTDRRMPYKADKSTDLDYFILTLFALVKETKARKERLSGKDIVLSIGLPPAEFGTQAKSFKNYFLERSKNGVNFELNGKKVNFYIRDVIVTPQNYAAVISQKSQLLRDFSTAFCIDIGDGTVDLLVMHKAQPDLSVRVSNKTGMAVLRANIINGIQQNFGYQLSSEDVENVLMDKKHVLDEKVVRYIKEQAERWTVHIVNELHTHVADFRTNPTILLGGGSILLRPYLEKSDAFRYIEFIDNINANAVGYAAIAYAKLGKNNNGN